jgi:uncharacterized protein YndB with AHSA1/START domain
MLPQPESAFFVIADISGYTNFLDAVELDHAQDIIADLMDTIVKRLRPPFRLAKFEGDAAFVYAAGAKADGSQLQDAIESAYLAFRKRLRNIRLATTCECSACEKMQTLDLKFVCHHGEFVKHRMGGREELVGRDVIVVHRLLKNTVAERVAGHAYALYSDAFVRAAGVDPSADSLVEHRETIDIIGDVTCWVRDLEQAWRDENDRQRSEVTRDKAMAVLEFEITAPRPMVWDYFNLPEHRPKWRAIDEVRETKQGARRGVGTVNHCMHGDHANIEEVIDWRPFDYLTFTTLLPMPGAAKVLMTYAFFETDTGGTRIEIRVVKPKAKDQAFFDQVVPPFAKRITGEVAVLKQMLEAQAPPPGLGEEPPLADLANRFVTQPIHAR